MTSSGVLAFHRRHFLLGTAGLALSTSFFTLAAGAQEAGTLKIGMLGLDTSDPHRHTGIIGVQQVYVEALTSIARDGSVEPWLAESIDVSEDGLTYTFKLRPDISFHNGDTLMASDVVANVNRVKKEISGGWLVSAMEYVDSVEAPDEMTIVIKMSEPYSPLLNLLSELWILSPKSEGWDATITLPIGTGPFTFGSWRPNDSFTAPAFDNYWMKGLPKLSAVWFDLREDTDNSLALQSGDLHIASLDPEPAETIKPMGIARISTLGDASWYSVAFNNRTPRPPFDDIRVRQAIGYCLDKQAIMQFAGGAEAVASDQMTAPGNFYFDQAMADADPFKASDIEKGKALLAEAGVNPAEHTIKFVSWQEDYAQIVVQMIRKLGFEVDHSALDDLDALQRLGGDDWDVNVMSSGPRADLFLRYVRLMSDGPNPVLWGNIQDADLDKLIKSASQEPDADKRRQFYLDAMQRVKDKLYFVVLGHAASIVGIRNEVRDFEPGFTYSMNWKSGGVANTSL